MGVPASGAQALVDEPLWVGSCTPRYSTNRAESALGFLLAGKIGGRRFSRDSGAI